MDPSGCYDDIGLGSIGGSSSICTLLPAFNLRRCRRPCTLLLLLLLLLLLQGRHQEPLPPSIAILVL